MSKQSDQHEVAVAAKVRIDKTTDLGRDKELYFLLLLSYPTLIGQVQ